MIRLVRVELSRLLHRRAVAVLLLLAIVIPAAILVGRVLNTRPPGADEIAQAEQQMAIDQEQRWFVRQVERCAEKPQRYGVDPDAADVEQACVESMSSLDNYLWWDRLSLAEEREGSAVAVVVVLGILMMLAGTTFTGHDWATGSMSNQLLFEPRRLRVWLAKGMVVAGVSALVSAVVLTAYWLGLYGVASSRDINLRDGVLLDSLQSGWRGAGVIACVGVAGLALTMLFRSTVVALGILGGIAIAGGAVLAVFGITNAWNPGIALLAVVNDGTTYWVDIPCDGGGEGCQAERVLTLTRGATYLGTALAVAIAASLASFRTRDVG